MDQNMFYSKAWQPEMIQNTAGSEKVVTSTYFFDYCL